MTFEDDLRRLQPLIGADRALSLWRAYQYEGADGRRDMEAAIRLQVEKSLGVNPLSPDRCLSVPGAEESIGEYILGSVLTGNRSLYDFGLREDEFIQHAAIFGRSGAGKTNTVALLIRTLVDHKKPFMIFDWKRNYRDLLDGPDPVPLEVYTVGRPVRPLRFNPLIPPPATDTKIWLKKLIEIISHAYYLGEGVMFMLQDALDQVYQRYGCYGDQAPQQWPTMKEVLEILQNTPVKGRKAMWLDSTLRAVQSLCFGQISDVINVSHSDSILALLDKSACLELNALANAEKVFFIETLMVWIHHFRMNQPDRETFKHCLIIEEAHNILSPAGKETVIDTMLREVRELGESIVLVDQHPSQISIPALGNTYCTIALNMKHSKDINALAEMMQVPRDDRDVFSTLPLGSAIVKLQSRYVHPFQIRIPKVALRKGAVTDAHLRQRPVSKSDLPESGQESEEKAPTQPSQPIPENRKSGAEPLKTVLSPIEEALLKDIHQYPFDGVVRRYSRLGLSRRRGNHAKESLIGKGVLQPVEIPTRTGKVVLLDFTPEMEAAMKRQDVPIRSRREGGLMHQYWIHQLESELVNEGWQVTVEHPLGEGRSVDLHATQGPTSVAIEVETGIRGLANIERLLERPYDWIVSFGTSEEVDRRTRRDLASSRISVNHVLFATPTNYPRILPVLKRSGART